MQSDSHFSFRFEKELLIKLAIVGLIILSLVLTYYLVQARKTLAWEKSHSSQLVSDKQDIQAQLQSSQDCIKLFDASQNTLAEYADHMDNSSKALAAGISSIWDEDWESAAQLIRSGTAEYQIAKDLFPGLTATFALIGAGNCSGDQPTKGDQTT